MMNMQSRNQYLQELRTEDPKTKSRKTKTDLLNEAAKRAKLNRKYLVEINKILKPRLVRKYIAQSEPVSVR